jgi:hypothetical protein
VPADPRPLTLGPASRTWRRRLGPLGWVVLEELAHQAQNTEQGWVAPVGVRDIGAAIGVTKDTAARAIAALRTARLVNPLRVTASNGRSRSGYLLNLPDGITIRSGPDDHDRAHQVNHVCPKPRDSLCPDTQDSPRTAVHQVDDSTSGAHRHQADRSSNRQTKWSEKGLSRPTQASLFECPNQSPG